MNFLIFKPTYKDRKSGQPRQSRTYHIQFRDHLKRRQRVVGMSREDATGRLALRLERLIQCRATGEPMSDELVRWIDILDTPLRQKLLDMELIDERSVYAETPLIGHLRRHKGGDGKADEPGYQQTLESRGTTAKHIKVTVRRIETILTGCGLVYWKDLVRPGAANKVELFLGRKRKAGEIGASINYFIRDFRSFCRWLKTSERAPAMAMDNLCALDNAKVDSEPGSDRVGCCRSLRPPRAVHRRDVLPHHVCREWRHAPPAYRRGAGNPLSFLF